MANNGNGFWTARKQTAAGANQGKWCVYRPDGVRFIVCESRKHAYQIQYALRMATKALGGNWSLIMSEG